MIDSTANWTAPKAANHLSKILNTFSAAHGTIRFPVDVEALALESANIFGWDDPIVEVKPANIESFEGGLFLDAGRDNWLLLYNDTLASPGRIRFTQAHELGHYILHRHQKDLFQCSKSDMFDWSDDEKNIEAQADRFASYLLMPLDDFRKQVNSKINLDLLGHCADRYGVSLTAVILKWLSYTKEKAVLVMSNDGFMDWAWSSNSAHKAGAYFKTRKNVIAIPNDSLAADGSITSDRQGKNIPATTWFKYAEHDMPLREMKIYSEQYDSVLTLLYLPQSADVWPPKFSDL